MNDFGKALREARIKKNRTLRELSGYTGKSISYLSDIEHGRKGVPNLEIVRKIEEFLCVSDDSLVSLASKFRRNLSPELTQKIQKNPIITEILMRTENLTDEQLEELLSEVKRKEENNAKGDPG